MTVKTKFIRVAVEGATTDGRKIERQWLLDMAANYNPATYTARVNCEHVRGWSPMAPFNAYGDVIALKADEIDIEIDGKTEKRIALFAQINALPNLVEIVKAGQKVFTSVEIAPDFADTGKAGLVGLAVTDNPASLGTEALQFAALKPHFEARKQAPDNLLAAAELAAIEFEAQQAEPKTSDSILGQIRTLLGLTRHEPATQPEAGPAIAPSAADLSSLAEKLTAGLTQAQAQAVAPVQSELAAMKAEVEKLAALVSQIEAPGKPRQLSTGTGTQHVTDC